MASLGEVTGFAGQWCTCRPTLADPLAQLGSIRFGPSREKPDDWEEIHRKVMDDLKKQGITSGPIGVAPAPTPVAPKPPAPPAPAMTPAEFVVWLRGVIAAHGGAENMGQGAMQVIAAKLDTLGGPK